ncbi:MAG: hypothetical protein J5962_06390, partial [Lachnospiraceae bacterium]|nr:hypothetical protein [Lachnospiraceae bacterium]
RIYNADYSVNVQCTSDENGYLKADIDGGQTSPDITTYLKADDTYTLYEYQAPSGYAQADVITFNIDKTGRLTVNGTLQTVNKITVVNQEIGVQFAKADNRGNYIAGAKMSIVAVDSVEAARFNGGRPYTFTSGLVPHNVSGTMFTEGQYYRLKEIAPPTGYAELDSYQGNGILFRYLDGKPVLVNQADGSSLTQQMIFGYNYQNNLLAISVGSLLNAVDMPLDVYISKTDITTAGYTVSTEIPGAKMKLVNSYGLTVDSWTSTNVAHKVSTRMLNVNETYTLIEEIAPDGMSITTEFEFYIDGDGTITSTDTNAVLAKKGSSDVVNWIKLVDDYLELKVKKYAKSTDGVVSNLAGAKLELYKLVGGVVTKVYEFDSTTGEVSIPNRYLVGGTTYILKEAQAPNGYAIAEDITFTINADGSITRDGRTISGNTIEMTDEELGVQITKEDMGGTTLPGATLEITSVEDTTFSMAPWVSGTTPKNISLTKFQPDKEYILTETIAPDGYGCKQESIIFKVDADGKVYVKVDGTFTLVTDSTITMQDAPLEVKVNKLARDTIRSLAGATIEVIDAATGTTVYTKVTEGSSFEIPNTVLKAGAGSAYREYILRETVAPEGYKLADDIKFAFDRYGTLYIQDVNGRYVPSTSTTIVMVDERNSIRISKVDITNGSELPGATIKITDATGNEVVPSWVSESTPHSVDISNFTRDTDYMLTEVTAPYGYDVAESITFKIDTEGRIHIKNASGTYTELDSSTLVMKD